MAVDEVGDAVARQPFDSIGEVFRRFTAPVVGATKLHHIEGAVAALDLHLTDDDLNYLEEMYTPHKLVGVMAQNKKNETEKPSWQATK